MAYPSAVTYPDAGLYPGLTALIEISGQDLLVPAAIDVSSLFVIRQISGPETIRPSFVETSQLLVSGVIQRTSSDHATLALVDTSAVVTKEIINSSDSLLPIFTERVLISGAGFSNLRVWNGSEWVSGRVRLSNGTSWYSPRVFRWSGTSWEILDA